MSKAKKSEQETGGKKFDRKMYDKELAKLHGELVKLQQWVVQKGLHWH